ncbi:condensation domain-containing protein, partial [Kitasatospora sp. NPDC059599]|uniref:condensation domain-containing protein n=1 Tax=Kitasatospora sp. NPDC059599 TaxID=3346880 RepID=UPI0036C336E9
YGLLRHLNPETTPQLARLPQPHIAFNYLGRFPAPQDLDWSVAVDADALTGGADDRMPLTHAIGINAITHDHPDGPQLSISLTWAGELLAEDDIRELGDTWVHALTVLAEHADAPDAGGLTPSDLPLVQLSQVEIDRLEQESRFSDVLPLPPLQEGLLFHALYDEQAPDVYVVQLALELQGELDAQRLRAAGQALLHRHPNLSARFLARGAGRSVQVIPAEVELPWTETDVSHADGTVERFLAEERARRFDMAKPPLLRFALLHHGSERHTLTLTLHHILLDGWSMPILIRELFTLYNEHGDGTVLPSVAPYKDYLTWLADRDREAARTAWRTALS